ncbi:hypothetical protein [Streptomyces sp. NPDC127033]|uniref:hypothetical protein n=1 Tax=Streptomyces sp. NPDC127033 TaxID=3347110 RepID=UPI003668A865
MSQSDNTENGYDRDEYEGDDAEVVAAELDEYRDGDVPDKGPTDVYLDVPVLNVDEIQLDVKDLRAHVSLNAEVLDLLKLSVGADVALGSVELDIKGVEAQAQLKVRLHNVATIVNRVLTTIDRNPEILTQLSKGLGQAVEEVGSGAGSAVKEIGSGTGGAVQDVGRGAGEAVEDVGHGAGAAVENVGEGAGAAAENVGEGAGEAVKDVGQGAGDTVGSVGQSAGAALEGVGEDVGQTVENTGRNVGEVAGKAGREGAREAGDTSEAVVSEGTETVGRAEKRIRKPVDSGSGRRIAPTAKHSRKPIRTSEGRRATSGDRGRNTRSARTAARHDTHKR